MTKQVFLAVALMTALTAPVRAAANDDNRLVSFDPARNGPSAKLQRILERVHSEHRLVPGIAAYVDAPTLDLRWSGATGKFSHSGTRRLSAKNPFRIASVQKVFTGAAILRLVEDGRLGLDDPVAPYLDPDQVDRMHVYEGVNYGGAITVRQLLNHTSGLNSHDECNEYPVGVATGPRRRWTPEEQIELMIDCGEPLFAPGTPGRWHYSDTGFVMLGTVLAKVTGKTYAAALRELLPLEALGIRQTWHELLEPAPDGLGPRAHQYVAAADLTDWDPSFDSWGGGGYVSTVEDLSRFVRALFEGRVLRKRSSLDLMTTAVPVEGAGPQGADTYGLGLRHVTYDGIGCWGHTGFWSSIALYCPKLDLAFALTTNQATDEHGEHTEGFVAAAIVELIKAEGAARRRLAVRPASVQRGSRRTFRFRFTVGQEPVDGAQVRFAGRRATTDASGAARIRVRLRSGSRRVARACKAGVGCASAVVRVRGGRR